MAAGPREVPESMLELHSLADVDYVDHFTLSTEVAADAEKWARALFGSALDIGGRLIWVWTLGLRLAPGTSPTTVAGWRIAARGDGWIRLEATSGTRHANLIVQTAAGTVSLGTFLHHDRRAGRLFWRPLSALHRTLVPPILRRAQARLRASREA